MSILREFTNAAVESARKAALERGVSPLLINKGITSLYPTASGEFAFLACGNHQRILAIAPKSRWEELAEEEYPAKVIGLPTKAQNEQTMAELIRNGYCVPAPDDKVQWLFVRKILESHFRPTETIAFRLLGWQPKQVSSVFELLEAYPEPSFPTKAEYLAEYEELYK